MRLNEMKTKLIIALALLALSGSANADAYTDTLYQHYTKAGELEGMCKADEATEKKRIAGMLMCIMTLATVADMSELLSHHGTPLKFCIPAEVGAKLLVDAYLAYMAQLRVDWQKEGGTPPLEQPAVAFAVLAFSKNFPCTETELQRRAQPGIDLLNDIKNLMEDMEQNQ